MSKSQCNFESVKQLLKMSLVPLPCQECLLSADGSITSESIEWLLDLKDKKPIWSHLNDINTSGYKRKLPMSMTKHYDIEIKGRLWSLWGHKRKHKCTSKSYMAITVMALCAARVISLNTWTRNLMDCIWRNGRQYYKTSLNNFKRDKEEFQLENLHSKCCLEGISFKVCLKTKQQGSLFITPFDCHLNLGYALKQFISGYQYGLLECNERILGFGFIDGPNGGYFMFDAQSSSYPLFPENISAPYLLRTNHLQVLLYCIIVSLNVTSINTPFCLHQLQIHIIKPNLLPAKSAPCQFDTCKSQRIIPEKYWQIPTLNSPQQTSKTSLLDKLEKCFNCTRKSVDKIQNEKKYRRRIHNITKQEVENSLIKPLVDADRNSDEDLKINKDFVRMICSDTTVPKMPDEEVGRYENDFVNDLLDVLVMGPKTCLQMNRAQNYKITRVMKTN
ncbi:uncharacterized protein ACRADG_005034 isoform 1-T1 [Cochliomyia hominivorax]